MAKLSKQERSELARHAALTRWDAYRKKKAKEKQLEADISP